MAKLTLQQTLDKSLKTTKQYIDTELAKKADSSHGTHVTWSTTTPKANGTATVGSETKVARGDHVHPLQTTVSGNAGTATKLQTARTLTVGNTGKTFDGSANVSWSLAEIGAAASSHTHNSITATSGSSWTNTAVPNATDCLINFYSHISKSATGLFTTGDNSNAIISINRHQGNYDSQLGFNSQGGIFYRYVDGTAMADSTTWYRVYTSLNKPTLADIGAAAASHEHSNMVQGDNTSRTTNQDGNANDLAASGFYRVSSTNSTSNPLPDGMHAHILHGQHPSMAGYKYQIAVPYSSTNKIYFRNNPNSSWGSWNRIYHTGDKPTAAEVGASALDHTHSYANKFLSRDEYTQITVNGDADKYYPVLLSTSNVSSYPTIIVSISRTYSWTAPSTWNTSTHKGGLTFTLEWNCSKYWDGNGTGNSNACYVTQFLESYCTMVAGLSSSTSGIVVWLRGGGALYQINSSIGKAVTAEVKLEGFTDSASQTFSVRDYNTTTVNNEIKKRWVNRSTSGVYDNNNRVYSAANPQTTINGLSFWTGTQAQYDALSSKSSTTVYLITG